MVSALDSRTKGLGLSSCREGNTALCSWENTSLSQSLSSPRCISGCQLSRRVGGGGEIEMFLVTLCYVSAPTLWATWLVCRLSHLRYITFKCSFVFP